MKRFLPLIIPAVIIFLPLILTPSCANTTQAPSGGDKDTIPPYIVDIFPLPGTVGVPLQGAKFYFLFNEYVTIKQARNIFLSPPQSKPLKAKLKEKGIVVTFEEPLDSNTTYTISFVDAVADNNEGNMFAGYTYVFSTGENIDSMMITGTVQDCNTLLPVKGATVMLYKDHSDSAVFLKRPYAAAKTDDWGYFCLPYIQDTLYRIYALMDDSGNNIYDSDVDLIGFVDSLIRPVMTANDTVKEMLKYEMTDTLSCMERKSEYEMNLFREKPRKQFLKNQARTGEYSAYVSFQAPYVWIDSLWIKGYDSDHIITQFNPLQDSLEIWLNDTKETPDTMHLFINYRKTDSLGRLTPNFEHIKLFQEGVGKKKKKGSYAAKKEMKHEDTVCVFKLSAEPENVDVNGFELEFNLPITKAKFDSVELKSVNPKQQEKKEQFIIERDSTNLRKYNIKLNGEIQGGYDYVMKIPQSTFTDIRGFTSDSIEVKVTLPNDDALSTIKLHVEGVSNKIIVDLLNEQRDKIVRRYVISSEQTLAFPYLKSGKYYIRITDDKNGNSIVDTGSLLDHRMPEKVKYMEFGKNKYIDVPESSEIEQTVNINEIFN